MGRPGATPGPVLETARLILRPPDARDLPGFVAMGADAEVMAHLGGVQTPGVAWRTLCTLAGSWCVNGFSMFSLIEKASGRWVGRAGPWQPEGWPGTEVGWGLIREAHGHGLAHEAAVACIDFAVDRLGWTQVIHCIDPENHSSARLAQRLGARVLWQQETPAPFAGMVWNVWGQDAGAWRARRGAITPA